MRGSCFHPHHRFCLSVLGSWVLCVRAHCVPTERTSLASVGVVGAFVRTHCVPTERTSLASVGVVGAFVHAHCVPTERTSLALHVHVRGAHAWRASICSSRSSVISALARLQPFLTEPRLGNSNWAKLSLFLSRMLQRLRACRRSTWAILLFGTRRS